MKVCIWCRKDETKKTFKKKAHIFPQSLGGNRICILVCDDCNSYFGNKQPGVPSVEIALKEPLNISRYFLMNSTSTSIKKGQIKFKSEYFDYDLKTHLVKSKFKFNRVSTFENSFLKQFQRGLYKVFLEERSESVGDALDTRFDFIREYARYGLGDYPVYYCTPNIPAVMVSQDLYEPMIRFTEDLEKQMKQFGFYSYFFGVHTFAFPVISHWEITHDNYIRFQKESKNPLCSKMTLLKSIFDIDITFKYAFEH